MSATNFSKKKWYWFLIEVLYKVIFRNILSKSCPKKKIQIILSMLLNRVILNFFKLSMWFTANTSMWNNWYCCCFVYSVQGVHSYRYVWIHVVQTPTLYWAQHKAAVTLVWFVADWIRTCTLDYILALVFNHVQKWTRCKLKSEQQSYWRSRFYTI